MATNPNRRAVVLGVFILASLLIMMTAILAVGNINNTFARKIQVTALFDDVNGLLIGANIWRSGMKVGTVKSMEFLDESKLKVTLYITTESQPFIPMDAKVKIGSDGLIGNKIVVITGGTPGTRSVQEGDQLGVEKVMGVEDAVAILKENNTRIEAIMADVKEITGGLAEGKGALGKLLKDDELYTRINTAMNSLQRTATQAEKISTSLAQYTRELNDGNGLAHSLATDTAVFGRIDQASLELTQITATAAILAENLRAVSERLQQKDNPAGMLLNDPGAASEIQATIKHIESSTLKLDENLEAMRSSFPFKRYFKQKAKQENK